ncbi:23S rRNA (adenine(1618)-N(6))-methyltransferase RlmF [Myroides sp. LJL115]
MKNSKGKLHPRSKHNELYDFKELVNHVSELQGYIIKNPLGIDTIDFSNYSAVKCLNKAILAKDYQINSWDIPQQNLCPPIPGRADYIHYLNDLLQEKEYEKPSEITSISILDIGTGASMIYPLIGCREYNWSFLASDISKASLDNAQKIINANPNLAVKVQLKVQSNSNHILKGIITLNHYFDAVMCNPPFFNSKEQYNSQANRKNANLGNKKNIENRNFSGSSNELYCPGGERRFIENYIYESRHYAKQVGWFTTLVSNKDNLFFLKSLLKRLKVDSSQIIPMQQGNKVSRILAWRF